MTPRKAASPKSVKKAAKVRRVILGVGHPWFFLNNRRVQPNLGPISVVGLTAEDGTFQKWISIDPKGTGNWNRIRLVAEILPPKRAKR